MKGGFPLNILIIDDMSVPEKNRANSAGRCEFFRLEEENFSRRLFLAKEFAKSGANVLLVRMERCRKNAEIPFCYSENEGISMVSVPVNAQKTSSMFSFRELMDFSGEIFDNGKSLGGLFSPDAVICSGLLPFYSGAAAKIAESAGAVLITELACSPAELLQKCGLCGALNPMLLVLKRAFRLAVRKSEGVIGLYPEFFAELSGAHGLYPMENSSFNAEYVPDDEAKRKKEVLSAFGEGETFVLACPNPLESGFSIEELIFVCAELGNKFALVFTGEGRRKSAFKKLVAEKGFTNIYFMDAVFEDEAPFVLSAADGIFLAENDLAKGFSSDSKRFFSAFGAKRPVIASAQHFSEFFRKSSGTIITKPKNKESIRLGIKTLMNMTAADRDVLGSACGNFAEKNSAKNFAAGYFQLIDNLIKQKENRK